MIEYNVIGLMSGTSLDGLDIAYCSFLLENGIWSYRIPHAETISYTDEWQHQLRTAPTLSGEELTELDFSFGRYCGKQASDFIRKHKISPSFISSHGHTVFHQPHKGFTLQIGHGAAIAAASGHKVICDFRTLDVALGGQGAPLVPIGDKLLFGEYDYCLNLGGFANISFENNSERIAYDICPANIVLNKWAMKLGQNYDMNGELGKTGRADPTLLKRLNSIPYYNQSPPKSLGKEWLDEHFIPVVEKTSINSIDIMASMYQHIAIQIGVHLQKENSRVLVSGGGAKNSFLISCLRNFSKSYIEIPSTILIDYKEALVFAFLGVLRMRNEVNTLASVTGASRDSAGGCVYI